ncbi:MAG: methyltransferase [Candidatus Bathyarchaeota archaeon]|nr:methyltransferase [Candidatus Bathyarchaeota archaeon]
MATILDTLADNLHYGDWFSFLGWFLIFALFLAFLPFNRKSGIKPTSVYIAFIVASAFEMFGIPLSMYFVGWAFGVTLPLGVLWGHTLQGWAGYLSMYVGYGLNLVGAALIYYGWRAVYRDYWGREEGEGKLVTGGVYSYSRHPQYAGFLLLTLGLLVHWATIPLLIMWPILVFQYYRLAKKEEKEMENEFGEEYTKYQQKTPMFLLRVTPYPK